MSWLQVLSCRNGGIGPRVGSACADHRETAGEARSTAASVERGVGSAEQTKYHLSGEGGALCTLPVRQRRLEQFCLCQPPRCFVPPGAGAVHACGGASVRPSVRPSVTFRVLPWWCCCFLLNEGERGKDCTILFRLSDPSLIGAVLQTSRGVKFLEVLSYGEWSS